VRCTIFMLPLTLAMGVVLDMIANQLLNAHQPGVKIAERFRKALVGIDGKEMVVLYAEVAPGGVVPKHYHHVEVFGCLLEGEMTLEEEGGSKVAVKAGEVFHEFPRRVYHLKNASATAPAKAIIFSIADNGQPLMVLEQEALPDF